MGHYTYKSLPDHPLAQRGGLVPTHRAVMYAWIGPGVHECYWCGTLITWAIRGNSHGAVVVDHLDGDGANNDLANLVPSCCACNALRGKGWRKFSEHLDRVERRRAMRNWPLAGQGFSPYADVPMS